MSEHFTSLIDALDMSIKKINGIYADHWILTGDRNVESIKISSVPDNIDEYFDKVYDLQTHNYIEICVCLNGDFSMQMKDSIFDISAGDTCLILPGVLHSELPKKNSSYESIWISIHFDLVNIHLSGRNYEDGLFYTKDGNTLTCNKEFRFITSSINDEFTDKATYFYDVAKSNVLQLLILILRKIMAQGDNKHGSEPWKDNIVSQVKQYIYKNYSNAIRLNDISHELCISPNYLNSIFKFVTGKTIIQYLEEYRIDKARQLLKDSKKSINEISHQLGYYDQYHFSKIFKKATGYSPLLYRKS